MSSVRIVGLVLAFCVLVILFELLRRHRLREKYAVIWAVLSLAAIVGAVFPGVVNAATRLLGLHLPSNLLFLVSTVVLLGLTLQFSFELGRTEERVRTLAEEVALLRLEIERRGHAPGDADG